MHILSILDIQRCLHLHSCKLLHEVHILHGIEKHQAEQSSDERTYNAHSLV